MQKTIIYQMHGLVSVTGNKPHKNMIYYLEKATCRMVTKVFAVSPSLMKFAIKNKYCNASKIGVIGNGTINGIDFQEKFNPAVVIKNKYLNKEITNKKFIVGFVGRISLDKGIEDFLIVLNQLKKQIPICGVIAGPNESKTDFQILLNQYYLNSNSEDLIIINEINDPQNLISNFDVFLFPTRREGFGLVAAEANALKIPVVGYNIPGVQDAVENNVTGILVEYGNTQKLSQAILEYYHNPKLKYEHGKNGRERVKRLYNQEYLWNEIFIEYRSLYNS